MKKIGITADCSSGLEYAPFEHDIRITRTTIHFGDETLTDGIDITADGFYDKLSKTDIVPSTSAPAPEEVIKKINELKNEGCTDIIHFPISFGLSDYGKNLECTVEDFTEDVNFKVMNSNTACLMEGYVAHYAEILANKGYSMEEIFEEVPKLRDRINAYFVVDDLKYLVKNGRLNAFAGTIGSLMRIKPILTLGKSGKIETFEKVKTHNRAVARMIDLITEYGNQFDKVLYIALHTCRKEDCEKVAETISSRVNNAVRVEVTTITPTVGAHIGCGILGMACIPLDGLKEEL